MGVYIPNMKMPEKCGECRFAVDGWCYAYGKPNIDALANDGRTNFCPLVPVPAHGRLIDGDALERLGFHTAVAYTGTMPYEYIAMSISHAPTIIPAEEGE